MASTTYDINVRYELQDRATKKAAAIGQEFQKTARHGRGLLSTMKVVAAGAALGFGLRAGKKWLIDYNSEMDNAKIKMGALVKLSLGGTWAANQKRANTLVKQFTKDAAVGVGTTADYVELAGDITKPLLDAGGSMRDLTELTKAGVTAAKAFGIAGDVAGRDIQSMMLGTVKSVDRLPKLLGVAGESWNEMVKEEGPAEMLRQLDKVLNSKTMTEAAEAYGQSWDGVTSTLEDNLQRTLGAVGLPLMKALTKEVQSMNSYFENNQPKVKKFVKDFSEGLIGGFKFVKKIVLLIVDNASALKSIAKAFLGFKLIQGAGGLLAGPFDMMASYSKKMATAGTATKSFADKATSAGNKLQGVASLLGAVYMGARLLADKIDRDQEKGLKTIERRPQAFLGASAGSSKSDKGSSDARVLAEARSAGLVKNGKINRERYSNAVRGRAGEMGSGAMNREIAMAQMANPFKANISYRDTLENSGADKRSLESFDRLERILSDARKAEQNEFAQGLKLLGQELTQFLKQGGNVASWNMASGFDQDGVSMGAFNAVSGEGSYAGTGKKSAKPTKKNGDVRVYIDSIKVVSDNPDRFAIDVVGAFKNVNTKPTASRLRIPGGRPA